MIRFPAALLVSCFVIFDFSAYADINLQPVREFSVGSTIGTLRATPIRIDKNRRGFLLLCSADKEIDPWMEMFYVPTDPLKMAVYTTDGQLVWKKEFHKGVLNGVWFTPLFPFDLDEDGSDEIYFVYNTDPVHILSYDNQVMEAFDSRTGKSMGQWNWHRQEVKNVMHRNFVFGGYSGGKPTLVTAQGTYFNMALQGWGVGMKKKWDLFIGEDEPGARGSHMCPVVDLNHDGIDEIMWGERCISIETGKYLFIADRDVWHRHSDVIQPTRDRQTGTWSIFTCRESGENGEIKPRVVMFDKEGNRIWSDLEKGHMDMGWTAHPLPNETIAFTISRGEKISGPSGFIRHNVQEYVYDAATGKRLKLSFPGYNTVPVDIDGDGYHEFASGMGEQSDRNVYDYDGKVIGRIGENAYIAAASKLLDLPGEHILCYYPNGTVKIWADVNAEDSDVARKRYSHPYYSLSQRLTATGYNMVELGGL